MKIENNIHPFLKRALELSIEHLGIQRSATDILLVLFLEKQNNNPALSIREIVQRSTLSLSSVSVLCSRLEIEGILMRRSDNSSQGRGRRRILYEFAIGIDELLAVGISKYMKEIGRICRDIKLFKKQNVDTDISQNDILNRLESEICTFFSEHSRLASESSHLWIGIESNDEIDLNGRIVEGAF